MYRYTLMKIESGAVVATFLMSLYSFWVAFLIEKKKGKAWGYYGNLPYELICLLGLGVASPHEQENRVRGHQGSFLYDFIRLLSFGVAILL